MIVTYGTYKHHQRFVCELLPMHTSDTLLHDALDLLEHVGIFFIDPVSQVSTIIQDLTFGGKTIYYRRGGGDQISFLCWFIHISRVLYLKDLFLLQNSRYITIMVDSVC